MPHQLLAVLHSVRIKLVLKTWRSCLFSSKCVWLVAERGYGKLFISMELAVIAGVGSSFRMSLHYFKTFSYEI